MDRTHNAGDLNGPRIVSYYKFTSTLCWKSRNMIHFSWTLRFTLFTSHKHQLVWQKWKWRCHQRRENYLAYLRCLPEKQGVKRIRANVSLIYQYEFSAKKCWNAQSLQPHGSNPTQKKLLLQVILFAKKLRTKVYGMHYLLPFAKVWFSFWFDCCLNPSTSAITSMKIHWIWSKLESFC